MRDPLSDIWAKSPRGGRDAESLLVHTSNLLTVAGQLARRSPRLAGLVDDPDLWHRVYWACCLHDAGKMANRFQMYLRGRASPWKRRHEVLSLAFLPAVAELGSDDSAWIAAAVASHHKDAEVLLSAYDPALDSRDLDLEAMVAEMPDEAVLRLWEWLHEDAVALVQHHRLDEFGVRVNGERTWLKTPDEFRRVAPGLIHGALKQYSDLYARLRDQPSADERRRAMVLRGLVLLCDHLASAHAPNLSRLIVPEAEKLFTRVAALGSVAPRGYQTACATSDGSILVCAPTGSGKTEAALLWARRQQQSHRAGARLIYVLPYQASINAMRTRLREALGGEVGLLHSRAVQAVYREVMAREDYLPEAAERHARRAADLARLHQPPGCVTTPYQLLRAAYRLPGYESMWASLVNALVVVDEVHAYEPGRLGLILALLEELVANWGVRVCSLSATMPSWLRRMLTQATGAAPVAVEPDLFQAFRRHRLVLRQGEVISPANLQRAANLAGGGQAVLVAVNTVRRAQEAYQNLRSSLDSERRLLLHSRFTARDRLAKEEEIQDRSGTGAQRGEGIVVVATQVVEVSLDLDFDAVMSDPAPLDALVQRFGRVNRRGRLGEAPVEVFAEPNDGQGVYEDELVKGSLQVLASHNGELIDEAVLSEWLDAVYSGEVLDRVEKRVRDARRNFQRGCLRDLRPFQSDEQLADQFDELFDGTEVLPACLLSEYDRLAEDSRLQAAALLVPVPKRAVARAREAIRWDRERRMRVANLPYDSETGLQLAPAHEGGD